VFLVLAPWWPSQESDWAKIRFPTVATSSHRLTTGEPKTSMMVKWDLFFVQTHYYTDTIHLPHILADILSNLPLSIDDETLAVMECYIYLREQFITQESIFKIVFYVTHCIIDSKFCHFFCKPSH
jgi:hypothetical protein